MIKVAFLVNPISGKNGNTLHAKELEPFLDHTKVNHVIEHSTSKDHLVALTKRFITLDYDIIIVAGGDGTINTVARSLVNSHIILGILPRGSGNGLAGHLKLRDSIESLCAAVLRKRFIAIDCGVVNSHYFFSNFGLGYPAAVIKKYDDDIKRGFITYLKHSIISLCSKTKYPITINNIATTHDSLMVSNSKFMGYNISLTPMAQLDSGNLEVVTARSKSNLVLKSLAIILLKKNYARRYKKLLIKTSGDCPAQIDGEPIISDSTYDIKIIEKGLKILI